MFAVLRPPLSAVVFVTAAALLPAADTPPELRLPGDVVPTSYRAALKLDPAQPSFTGDIHLEINIKQPTRTIWLNASQIEIQSAKLTRNGSITKAEPVPGNKDFIGVRLPHAIDAGPAELEIAYTANVRHGASAGVFSMEQDGNKFLFTQFESTDARDAFPCFDEPSYKVPWQLTLTIPADDDAVSNTDPGSTESHGTEKTLHFNRTKPLPSYLVAFAVGKFDFVPAGYAGKNRAPVRIVTPRGHAREAQYAAEVTATILTGLEDYFGIPFPYEKSDQVAIPVTFGFGAMENAGMVTYAANLLLANPDRDTEQRRRSYASVAAHELAHQWFGDLVTTAWWNDIWLNEAFATWMEQKLITEWKPEWETRSADVNSKLGAQAEDTLTSARKIRQEIRSKDDISNAFDGITYQKGAAVIGMFENWVGDGPFRKGVHAYLTKYAFGNASAPEFLASVSQASGKDITAPFSSFLNQPGVPLVSMSLRCGGAAPVLHLEQRRSLPVGETATHSETWQIPVCVRFAAGGSQQQACTLFGDPHEDWKLQAKGCPAWVEGNAKAVGYYRVDYQNELLPKLTSEARQLSTSERVDFLGNAQALATTGELPDGKVLALVPEFSADESRYVVERAMDIAGMPREHFVPEDLLPKYEKFIRDNFAARAHELGWLPKPRESDNARLLRPALLPFVTTTGGDEQLARQARELAEKWVADHKAIPADVAPAILRTAAYYGDRAFFDQLMAALAASRDRQERRSIISALASFREPNLLRAGMQTVLDGKIPFIEGMQLLFAGQGNSGTRKIAFDFMKDNFDQLAAKRPVGGGADAGARFVRVGSSYCDEQSANELKSFFEPRIRQFVGAPRLLAQTLEEVHACIAEKQKQEPSVEEFLKGI
jgi:alanyl aminopeptidase